MLDFEHLEIGTEDTSVPLFTVNGLGKLLLLSAATVTVADAAVKIPASHPHSDRAAWIVIASRPEGPTSRSASLTPAQGLVPACPPPAFELTPISAGRARIVIQSECRRFETVRLRYANAEFIRAFDETGTLDFVLDCFAGDNIPATAEFEDGTTASETVRALDLDRMTKIAVLWSAPVNLDLHAFEYSALPESPDHVWAGAQRTEQDALRAVADTKRGHGFLSTSSTGEENGSKVEVYSFFHSPDQKRGVINMALDYESRSRSQRNIDTCGSGLYSELEFEAIKLEQNQSADRMFRKFLPLNCAMTLSGIDRLNHKTVPEIVIRN